MKNRNWIPASLLGLFAALFIAGCASNNEPEKDPIFDVTGQGQQSQQ